jgi:hypothetical protein
LWPRGMVQPPLTEADQRSLALQATQNQRRPEQEVSVRFSAPAMSQQEWLSSQQKPGEDGDEGNDQDEDEESELSTPAPSSPGD